MVWVHLGPIAAGARGGTHISSQLGEKPPKLPHLLALIGFDVGEVAAGGLRGQWGVSGHLSPCLGMHEAHEGLAPTRQRVADAPPVPSGTDVRVLGRGPGVNTPTGGYRGRALDLSPF